MNPIFARLAEDFPTEFGLPKIAPPEPLGEAEGVDVLTAEEIAELAAVSEGADVWGYSNAMRLRSVQRKAPQLINICKAMEQPPGHMQQPYFGAIATRAGLDFLSRIGGAK